MRFYIFLLILISFHSITYAKDLYIFSQVSTETKESSLASINPFLDYLENNIKKPVKFKYIESHKKLLEEFTKGEIDIALIGPGPFVILKKIFKDYEPIAMENEKDGKPYFRCVLTTVIDSNVTLRNIKSVAMPDPIAVCGNMFVNSILKHQKSDLKNIKYEYIGNAENVALEVLAGRFDAGSTKDSIFERYEKLGLKLLFQSDLFPGRVLIANKKSLSKDDIILLKTAVLNIPHSTKENFKLGRYGFSKFDENIYKDFEKSIDNKMIEMIYEKN